MQPEVPLLHSQVSATGRYPEPDESILQPPTPFPSDPFQYYSSIYA